MTTQRNAEIATEFLALVASGRVREAFAHHIADAFTHHNAYFAGDRESLLVAMEQSAETEPNQSFVVKQVIGSGDRVAVFSHLKRAHSDQEYAVVHILRFEGDKVIEMWDVGQEVPRNSPNSLGMF